MLAQERHGRRSHGMNCRVAQRCGCQPMQPVDRRGGQGERMKREVGQDLGNRGWRFVVASTGAAAMMMIRGRTRRRRCMIVHRRGRRSGMFALMTAFVVPASLDLMIFQLHRAEGTGPLAAAAARQVCEFAAT